MIVEIGHFHFAEKHWGAKALLAPLVPTALVLHKLAEK